MNYFWVLKGLYNTFITSAWWGGEPLNLTASPQCWRDILRACAKNTFPWELVWCSNPETGSDILCPKTDFTGSRKICFRHHGDILSDSSFLFIFTFHLPCIERSCCCQESTIDNNSVIGSVSSTMDHDRFLGYFFLFSLLFPFQNSIFIECLKASAEHVWTLHWKDYKSPGVLN